MFVADRNILTAKPEAHIDFAIEIACRLDCVDASKSGRLKEYYKGTLGRKIRPLALAILKNSKNQFLFHKAVDSTKNETFYRPLGGGIEFHESGETAIAREIEEELGQQVSVSGLVATFENIFVYEGKKGHEIVCSLIPNSSIPKTIKSLNLILLKVVRSSTKQSGELLSKFALKARSCTHLE